MRRSSYELNDKEKKVLATFSKAGDELSIEDMARRAFDTKRYGASPKTRGNSWVRNSVRKLLRLKLVRGGDKSGKYVRTELKPDEVLKTALKEIEEQASARAERAAKPKKAKVKAAKAA